MQHVDISRIKRNLFKYKTDFRNAKPFPHIILDQFLHRESCNLLLLEHEAIPEGKWVQYHHGNESKLGFHLVDQMGSHAQAIFNELTSKTFIDVLEQITAISPLVVDRELDGAGFHNIKNNGFLNVHTDYLSHTKKSHWSRQLNLLLYLNKKWDSNYGGNLEFWDRNMKRAVVSTEPLFNRCVIFHTSAISFHGHPDPLTCPTDESRRSLALYYFKEEDKKLPFSVTNYKPRPKDNFIDRLIIRLDRNLLFSYSFVKRYTPLKDIHVSNFLKLFRRCQSVKSDDHT